MRNFLLGALLIALSAVSARAQMPPTQGTLSAGRTDLGVESQKIEMLTRGSAKEEEIADKNNQFAGVLPAATANFKFKLHPWPSYRFIAKDATIASIMEAGDDAIRHGRSISEDTEVMQAKEQAEKMYADGKINFGTLNENQAGVYNYQAALRELGKIEANEIFRVLAHVVPPNLLYATIIHEARHALDHLSGKLDPKKIKPGEVSAFHSEWAYLKKISSDGKEIARQAQILDALMVETHKNPVVARAHAYVWSLVYLYRTDGKERELMDFVDKMGYQEDGGKAKSSAFSS